MAHLATERATRKDDMFKVVAFFCILVNGVPECTRYEHNSKTLYPELIACEKVAEEHFYGMMEDFIRFDIPFESLIIGCEKEED